VDWSEAETLDFRGAKPLSLKKQRLEEAMQQLHLTTYVDIAEVRTVTGAAACNKLLAEGWVLLDIFPVTRVGEMGAGKTGNGQEGKRIEDTQRYVRRLVGYVVGKRENGGEK
jgi:hypothetical protein